MMGDRNFDDIAEHFAKKVANARKGRLRRRVILQDLEPRISHQNALNVLDLGAGLGHLTLHFAQHHRVTYVDLSQKMMEHAQRLAAQQNLHAKVQWKHMSYQAFFQTNKGLFDVILCHAVLEWVAEPSRLIASLRQSLVDNGLLSLCFYNPAGRDMRNLVMGNFKLLDRVSNYQPDAKSLTPKNPCSLQQVEQWLSNNGLAIESLSGIRVFSDYVSQRRGGLADEDAIEEMELRYSSQEPFNRIGRYVHIIARKQ